MPDPKSTTITVRVSHELFDVLKGLAKADKRTLSQYCRIVLEEHAEKANEAGSAGVRDGK